MLSGFVIDGSGVTRSMIDTPPPGMAKLIESESDIRFASVIAARSEHSPKASRQSPSLESSGRSAAVVTVNVTAPAGQDGTAMAAASAAVANRRRIIVGF